MKGFLTLIYDIKLRMEAMNVSNKQHTDHGQLAGKNNQKRKTMKKIIIVKVLVSFSF